MKGWHHESMRHALAARGINTTEFKNKNNLPTGYTTEINEYKDDERIDYTIFVYKDGKIPAIASNYFFVEDGIIHAEHIYVNSDHRKKGLFDYMMKKMIDLADKLKYPIELEIEPNVYVSPTGGEMNTNQLYAQYQKFGFKEYGPRSEHSQMEWYSEMNRVDSENIQMWRDPQ